MAQNKQIVKRQSWSARGLTIAQTLYTSALTIAQAFHTWILLPAINFGAWVLDPGLVGDFVIGAGLVAYFNIAGAILSTGFWDISFFLIVSFIVGSGVVTFRAILAEWNEWLAKKRGEDNEGFPDVAPLYQIIPLIMGTLALFIDYLYQEKPKQIPHATEEEE